jgi:three-Cys-motif partner protein
MAPRRRSHEEADPEPLRPTQLFPFDGLTVHRPVRLDRREQEQPVWTKSKARLIEAYLRLFGMVTRHGTYIDGFAGPQRPEAETPEFAAKLVVEITPAKLRHFHLFDVDATQVAALRRLRADHPDKDIHIHPGDFNHQVDRVLKAEVIKPREATFCLLDQRTFECHWATVERLAGHPKQGYKIELFYFLASWWFERSCAGLRDERVLARWWGREDWPDVPRMRRVPRALALVQRFHKELGYTHVKHWPIFGEPAGFQTVMYYMIHASDHPEAPKLMERAYRQMVTKDSGQQLGLL